MGWHIRANVVLARVNGLPEDAVVNTFHFFSPNVGEPTSGNYDELETRLEGFYGSVHAPGTQEIAEFIGEQIDRGANACRIDFYAKEEGDLTDPWGSPKATRSFTMLAVAGGTPLPAEVAFVMSFHGDLTDIPETAVNPDPPPAIIRPASRRRGRIYLGPLQSTVLTEDASTHEMLISTAFRDACVGAGAFLIDENDGDLQWVVFSELEGEHQITGGFVNDAPDTQRRRGNAPTGRTTFS